MAPLAVLGLEQTGHAALQALQRIGRIVPAIDRCFPLAKAVEALRYLATGRAQGKVVLVP